MAETFFLSSLEAYLAGAGLGAAHVRLDEPILAGELPAIVLSLEASARANPGIGERAQLVTRGALPWQATIDLANPVLPEEPAFVLLDPTRRQLVLPHGGLVRSDGSDPETAPLGPPDIRVLVSGAARTLVTGAPGVSQVRADGRIGTLTFGDALAATGSVVVSYFLGQWEQRFERISGVLRLDVCAASAGEARTLSDAAIGALLAPVSKQQVRRLLALSITSLSSIGIPEGAPSFRRRSARLAFTFEREVNHPQSSGGIIGRIPVQSRLGDGDDPPGITPESTEGFTVHA